MKTAILLLCCCGVLGAAPLREFIYMSAPFASAHASTVVELRNGDLLSAWFGGSAEGHSDVAIWSSRRSASGWSAPVELAREHDVLPVRVRDYTSSYIDMMCLSGRVAWGRMTPMDGGGKAPLKSSPIALLQREHAALWRTANDA